MGIIPRITCRRCGRIYSGIRSRCPYCGTSRVTQSERTPTPTPGENPATQAGRRAAAQNKWQLIFAGILVVAIILAVIVLVSTTLNKKPPVEPFTPPPMTFTPPPPPPTETLTPEPTPTVTQLTVTYGGEAQPDFSTYVGSEIKLTPIIYPSEISPDKVNWTSEDESIATVEDGLVKAVGPGTTNIIAECYGVTYTTICRVRGD